MDHLEIHSEQSKNIKVGNGVMRVELKRCSMSLIVREMQIKTTMKYHLTSVRMAIINESTNDKCWPGCRQKGTLMYCWWECKLVQPVWKAV